jgi:hypothetical protein
MMNFVQQQDDLRDFDDQSLADELQSGRRGYHPMAVAAEMQSRLKERSDAQQQMMAQQAQQNQPVAQRQLMEFMAQAQPAEVTPEMMPPEMAMQGGMEGMPPEMMAAMPAAMPPEMPAEAPVGIAAGMPQQMSGGGIVRRAQTGMTPSQLKAEAEKILTISPINRTARQNEILRAAGYQLSQRKQDPTGPIAQAEATLRSPFLRKMFTDEAYLLSDEELASAPGAGALNERLARSLGATQYVPQTVSNVPTPVESTAPAVQRPSIATGYGTKGVSADEIPLFDRMPRTDYSGATTTTDRGVTTLPTYTPSSFDFSGAYERNLGDLQLQPVTIRSPRATEQSVRDASFFAEERGRLSKFAPDKERFQRESQSDLLVGLGSVIAGATQRGDIAKGLAQLAAQQREARRGFRQEEREYAGLQSALFREERGERRELARERRQIEREDEAAAAALRGEARQLTALQMEAQKQIEDANYKVQELAQKIKIARAEAELKGSNAQLDYLIKVLNMELIQARTQLANAQQNQINIKNEVESRFRSTGTSASQVRSATSGGQ